MRLCAFLLSLWLGAALLRAHDAGFSTFQVQSQTNPITWTVLMAPADVLTLANVDSNHDGELSKTELDTGATALSAYFTEGIEFSSGGLDLKPTAFQFRLPDPQTVQIQGTLPDSFASGFKLRSLMLTDLPPNHHQYASVVDQAGNVLTEALLSVDQFELAWNGSALHAAPASGWHRFGLFFKHGMLHIFTGWDHMVFILGLLLTGLTLSNALKVITAFTISHSLTLALAVLQIAQISPRIIEPLIAASIVVVGIENLRRPWDKNRWLLALAFGLIHGFGFASAASDLLAFRSRADAVFPLISFNLGIESGQILLALVLLPAIWRLSRLEIYKTRLLPAGSWGVILIGTYWMVQRIL